MKRNYLSYVILWLTGFLFIIPLYWLVASSLKSDSEITRYPPTLWPQKIMWNNFPKIWNYMNFERTFMNSLVVSVFVTLLVVLFSTMAGYAFSKKQFFGKDFLFSLYIVTMIVPPTVLLLPLYFIITKMGMYDTLTGLVIPFSVTVFGIFFTKQYIDDVPNELIEAARIDGMGELRIFFNIIVPVIRPVISTLAIIEFVQSWNAFTVPLVLLQTESKYTLPLRLAIIAHEDVAVPWSQILSANVLFLIPVLLIFIVLQKQLIEGLMSGAVKG